MSTVTDAPEIRLDLEQDDRVASRQARLARGVAALKVRGSSLALDRVLLIAGSVLLPLGALLILLGWFGASHTPNLYEQVPYAISGGLLGVALVGTGGFFYFGFWLTRQIYEDRRHNERLMASLGRIEARLAEQATGQPTGQSTGPLPVVPESAGWERNGSARPLRARPSAAAPAGAPAVAVPVFVATANGSMLHRPDCAVLANKDGLRRVPADTPGFKPCRICDPLTPD